MFGNLSASKDFLRYFAALARRIMGARHPVSVDQRLGSFVKNPTFYETWQLFFYAPYWRLHLCVKSSEQAAVRAYLMFFERNNVDCALMRSPLGFSLIYRSESWLERRLDVRLSTRIPALLLVVKITRRFMVQHPNSPETRGVALIGAVELARAAFAETPGALGIRAKALFREKGLMSRNMADAMAFCPALIITKRQVNEMSDIIQEGL